MPVRLNLAAGDLLYQLYNLARASVAGEAVEYEQFIERLDSGTATPTVDDGVEFGFYFETTNNLLYYRIGDTWTSVGGGSDLEIFSGDDEVAEAATKITFVGDGVTVAETTTDSNEVTVTIPGGGGGTDLTVTDGTTPISMVSDIEFSGDYFTVAEGSETTAAAITIDNVVADGTSGLMTGADKGILDGLNTYDLTVVSGDTRRSNPSELIFSDDGTSFFISTPDGGLHTYTPTDPTTGGFAENTEVFEGLDAAGETNATLTFTGGVDGNSVVQKNGITLQTPEDYLFTSTTVTILGTSRNGEEVTVINGGILDSIADDFTFSNNVTIDGNLVVDGTITLGDSITDQATVSGDLTVEGDLTVNGDTTLGDTIDDDTTVSGDLTVNGALIASGTSDLEGVVTGNGITNLITSIASQHGSGTLHVHATATSPGAVTTPDGNPLVTHLFEAEPDDYNDAIAFYSYDNTMTWRFTGNNVSLRSQFSKGDYYATNGYFSTTEVESDTVVSGQWLLLCTGVTQESSRLDVYFRVITDGILPASTNVGDEWQRRVPGSSEYVLNTTNADVTTSASRYNLVRADIANNGIVTQDSAGDYRIADTSDVYDSIAVGTDEDRRHILNELSGINGIPNSAVTATRDGVTWYSEGRGETGADSVASGTDHTIGTLSGLFYIEVIATDDDVPAFTPGQMIMFTIGAGDDLPAGISENTTYTAVVERGGFPIFEGTAHLYFLEDTIADGTSDVIVPDGTIANAAENVVLQAYHAQLNEEFILDPLDTIDSVDAMTADQKTELRDAARINFRNRFDFVQIRDENRMPIANASDLVSSADVYVTVRASGLSGITRLVLDFDGNLGRSFNDAATLDPLNTGDDVRLEIGPISLPSITYTDDTELEVELFIGTNPADIELEIGRLGDLLADGRTPEAADLVVTPERVESAIHNLADDDAREDVRTSLDVYSKAEVDAEVGGAGDTSTLSTAMYAWDTELVDAQVNLVLSETGTRGSAEVCRFVRVDDGSGNITYDVVATGNVRAGG